MGFKEGTGKLMVFIFTIIFNIGVIASCCSPQWIILTASEVNAQNQEQIEVQYGPFYSQTRTCTGSECTGWGKSVDISDCKYVEGSSGKLCNHLNTWRTLAICCLIIVLIGGFLVLAGCCCQCLTCGCVGNSMDCIVNMLFWIEVVLSIVAWSFVISFVNIIRDAPQILSTGYLWGFWVFISSGTILGAIYAITADWAAESSFFRSFFRCLTCRCNKD